MSPGLRLMLMTIWVTMLDLGSLAWTIVVVVAVSVAISWVEDEGKADR